MCYMKTKLFQIKFNLTSLCQIIIIICTLLYCLVFTQYTLHVTFDILCYLILFRGLRFENFLLFYFQS